MVTRFSPWNMTVPPVISAGGLSSRAIPNSIVDLPQPDSPTTPMNSPWLTSRSTPSTARTEPVCVAYSTRRSRTSRMGALGTEPPYRSPPDRPQCRIADLVEGVVEQGERHAQERHAQAGRDGPQRHAGLQRALVLRPVQHRAPAHRVGVAEAEELQAGRCQHGVQRGAEEVRHDEGRHRGQHLEQDDVQPAFAAYPRRFEEVPV